MVNETPAEAYERYGRTVFAQQVQLRNKTGEIGILRDHIRFLESVIFQVIDGLLTTPEEVQVALNNASLKSCIPPSKLLENCIRYTANQGLTPEDLTERDMAIHNYAEQVVRREEEVFDEYEDDFDEQELSVGQKKRLKKKRNKNKKLKRKKRYR